MIVFTGYWLLLFLNFAKPAPNRRCFPLYDGGSLCYTQPDPSVSLSWSSALQWCKNIGATLPILDISGYNTVYGNALGYFGLLSETLWLGANSTYDQNNWYWSNRTRFTEPIEGKYVQGKTHAYIMRNGTSIKFVSSSPFDTNDYICGISYYRNSESSCAYSEGSYWSGEKCYQKYSYSWTLITWYKYWSYCEPINRASYDDVKKFSKWLDNLKKYWVDLSCYWWTWQDIVTGTSREVAVSLFGDNLPSGTSDKCLASYKDSDYVSRRWINSDCSTRLQFICQQYVENATRPTTSTTTTPKIKPSDWWLQKTSTQSANITYLPIGNIETNSDNNGLVIGLGAGLIGGLFLVVTIWLALITVFAYRKIRDATESLIHLREQSAENPVTNSENSCNDYTVHIESGRAERMQGEDDIEYEALGLQAKEHDVYQPIKKKAKRLADATTRFTEIQTKQLKK